MYTDKYNNINFLGLLQKIYRSPVIHHRATLHCPIPIQEIAVFNCF